MSDLPVATQVKNRLDSLTKPPGSLGILEEIALRYCIIRNESMPPPPRKGLFVFCGDHGVTAEGVSPYPSEVTRQMAMNFVRGGAAINVLCRQYDVEVAVIDAGIRGEPVSGVTNKRIDSGTNNFAVEPAMTRDQAAQAIRMGEYIAQTAAERFDLLAAGEMGIGNTTSAAAIFSALTGRDPAETTGAGTGLSVEKVTHKAGVIRRALELHPPQPSDPVGILAAVGGFEIGAIAGFYLGAAKSKTPFVVDGFIASAAAMLANSIDPTCLSAGFFAHQSAEAGHRLMLSDLAARPLLALDMRLGEGTGAVFGMSLIEAAIRLYREMATFQEAAVSGIE